MQFCDLLENPFCLLHIFLRISLQAVSPHLFLWAIYRPPVVVLDLLQLVKFYGDVIDGELQQVPEPSQVLRGGSRHGTGVLRSTGTRGKIKYS